MNQDDRWPLHGAESSFVRNLRQLGLTLIERTPRMTDIVRIEQPKMLCEDILLDPPAVKVVYVAPELPSPKRF